MTDKNKESGWIKRRRGLREDGCIVCKIPLDENVATRINGMADAAKVQFSVIARKIMNIGLSHLDEMQP